MEAPRYWIGVVTRDDVEHARTGGYAELNHGKASALERMRPGDGLAFYSPRATPEAREALQAFTAIGRVGTGAVYRADDRDAPAEGRFRRSVVYAAAGEAPIRPMIQALTFIHSKQHWGAAFRFGVLRVPREDFARIARAMGCDPGREFGLS